MMAYLMSYLIVLSCILVCTDSSNILPIPYAVPPEFFGVRAQSAPIVIRNSGRRSSSSSGILGFLPLLVLVSFMMPKMMPEEKKTTNNNQGSGSSAATTGTAVGTSAAAMGMMMIGGMMMMSMMSSAQTNVPSMQVVSGTRGTDGSVGGDGRGSDVLF